jgi:hypothetical protein
MRAPAPVRFYAIVLALLGPLAPLASHAQDTLYVPSAYTLPAAIEHSVAYHTVIVIAPGTYDISGLVIPANKDRIVLRSPGGDPSSVILDADGTVGLTCQGDAVLLGLTFRNGGAPDGGFGGGLLVDNASPTVTSCRFEDNHAPLGGGGVTVKGYLSRPVFSECAFTNNTAINHGAAVWVFDGSPDFIDCLFEGNETLSDNTVEDGGGAVSVASVASADFTRCRFLENRAARGGALYSLSSVNLIECIFHGNTAKWDAGAVRFRSSHVFAKVQGCTFDGNGAPAGGALVVDYSAQVDISQTLMTGGTDGEAIRCEPGNTVTIICSNLVDNYGGDWVGSCLEGRLGADGNISAAPDFCSADPAGDRNWDISANSPCAPGHSGCGRIGAGNVTCGPEPVQPSTWGQIKQRYVER